MLRHQAKNLIAILILVLGISLTYAADLIGEEYVNSTGTAKNGWTYSGSSTSSSYDSSSSSSSSSSSATEQSEQTISLALSDTTTNTTIDLTATAEGSGDIIYTSSTTNTCSVEGNQLYAFSIGACTVTATIAADANYLSASSSESITVSAGTSDAGDSCNTSCAGEGMKTIGDKYGYCFNSCLYTNCGKTGYNRCNDITISTDASGYLAPEMLIAAKCNNTAWVGLSDTNVILFMMDGKYASRSDWANRKIIRQHWRYIGNNKIPYSNTTKNWSPMGNRQRGACMWQ